jgi:hypothetical protein
MHVKTIILSLLLSAACFCSFCQDSDYYNFLNPIQDSVYIYFVPDNTRYFISERSLIEGNLGIQYFIPMELGIDLCFTNNYYPESIYKSKLPLDSIVNLEVRDYWWLYQNYQDMDMDRLLEKLNWGSTDFFLVVPDSAQQIAEIWHVFNCNNSSHVLEYDH